LPFGLDRVRFADVALENKALVYDLLFQAASETMLRIAAEPANRSAWLWSASRPNPRHLGARIGITAVLRT
jgi:hypothetical protein